MSLFALDWSMGHRFRSYDDDTTALNALGTPFALESAIRSLNGEDGTVFVFADGRGNVVGWFAVPASSLDVPFPRPDFFPEDAMFDVIPGEPPGLSVPRGLGS
jgi:hypothetical protein